MRRSVGCLLIVTLLVLFSSFAAWQPSFAQDQGGTHGLFDWQSSFYLSNNELFFPESGHKVTGDFLTAYLSIPNPKLIYGYPTTDAFPDKNSGQLVQYFQRARFELRPENPPELRVLLSPLGWYLYVPGDNIEVPRNSPNCRLYHETDSQVCFDFLTFFDANGGVAQFGYPISGFQIHSERIVQYFQRARFEWHPELPPGQRVVLADLGEEYFRDHGEELIHLWSNNAPSVVLRLRVRIFNQYPIMSRQGQQIVTIVVRDQNLQPVANAQVNVEVTLPTQDTITYLLKEPTNKDGVVRFSFDYRSTSVGSVILRAKVRYNQYDQTAVASFRLWY